MVAPEILKSPKVTRYYISGVWIVSGKVTHYAIHGCYGNGVSGAVKLSKDETVAMLSSDQKPVNVWGWDYRQKRFLEGKPVQVLDGYGERFLAPIPYEKHTKDLQHLINLSWFP